MNFDYSEKALLDRGKYLTEVIDTIPNKATYKDIEVLPEGKLIVPWSPSAGKTTAIRQFIVQNLSEKTGVFATKLIDDIEQFRYDVIAQAMYLRKMPKILCDKLIQSISSKEEFDVASVRLSNWVICSHERLFIEPSSLLFLRDTTFVYKVQKLSSVVRGYLFIDEYPTNLYKSFKVRDLYPVKSIDDKTGLDVIEDSATRMMIRNSFINEVYENYDNPKYSLDVGLVNNIPTPTNQSIDKDYKRGLDNPKSVASRNRVCFFSNILAEKLIEMEATNTYSDMIYYSIADLPPVNTYVFDGTGDLLTKESSIWTTIESKYPRRLSLIDNKVNLVRTKVKRRDSTDTIVEEYSRVISIIIKDNPKSKLLVYVWKNSKNTKDETELLSDKLSNLFPEVSFITYQSGKERVTSEYADSDIAVVLGSFYLPNPIIDLLNNITHSKSKSVDYTLSLLIQFLFRTQARKGLPIKLYIDNDYDYCIDDLCYNLNISNHTVSYLSDYTEDELLIKSEVDKVLGNKLSKTELVDLLGYSSKHTRPDRIISRLNKLGYEVEVLDDGRYSSYVINK